MSFNPDEYHIPPFINDFTSILFSSISVGISIYALSIAKKIVVSKSLKEKQFELVIDLITHISNLHFSLIKHNDKGGISESRLLSEFYIKEFKQQHSFFFTDERLFFIPEHSNRTGFRKYITNPLLPKKISNTLEKLAFPGNEQLCLLQSELSEKIKNYNLVMPSPTKTLEEFIDDVEKIPYVRYYDSDNFPTVESYYNLIVQLFKEINIWLEENKVVEMKFSRTYKK